MDRALIVRKPWIDLILDGHKTWEMRSRPTNIRGRIGLIEQGSGLIVGEVDLVDSLQAVTTRQKHDEFERHLVADFDLLKKWKYPWVIENAKRYSEPVAYQHKPGCVTWVKI